MFKGDLYALATYGTFSMADSLTKAVGTSLSPFEVIFFLAMFWPLSLGLVYGPKSWSLRIIRPKCKVLTPVRAALVALASAMSVLTFTHLPLADAYSLLFLGPSLLAIMSMVFLKEHITPLRWASVILGLAGVLIAVRPSFGEFNIGYPGGLLGATLGSLATLLMRRIGPQEEPLTMIANLWIASVVMNGLLMLPTFTWPTPAQWVMLVFAGMLAGLGQNLTITALRLIPANRMGPLQYSQMIWAILNGLIFFSEVPDLLKLIGIAVIIVSGALTVLEKNT